MSCNDISSANHSDNLADLSGSAMAGLEAYINEQRSLGFEPRLIGKAGPAISTASDILGIVSDYREQGLTPALISSSKVLGASAGAAGAVFVMGFLGVGGAVAMIAIAGAAYVGGEVGSSLGDSIFDPTLSPDFY